MRISCICWTYDRAATKPWLLAEAVESFLRQTHVDKELIILNDHPGQEIVCEAPGVRVVNTAPRFQSLGDKFNHGAMLATGDVVCEWDDDDISLPHRLEQAAKVIGEGWDYFNPRGYWFIDNGGLHHDHPMGYAVNCSAYTRQAFALAGGSARCTTGADAKLDQTFDRLGVRIWPGRQGPAEWAYIYRWGVSECHLSAFPDMEQAYAGQAQRATKTGRFVVKPEWRMDYAALCAARLEMLSQVG